MCNIPKLIYSPRFKVNVDLEDFHCTSAKNYEFGRIMPMRTNCGYKQNTMYGNGPKSCLYLHRIVADACVPNPRPDIFDVVDHIDHDPLNNDPSNLRWVNAHLNHNNLKTQEDRTPPGVNVRKRKTKNGKWYTYTRFRKNACILKSFRTLQKAVEFADTFNKNYFDRLYQAYVNSPRDPYEARLYWAEKAISVTEFRCNPRESRKLVLEGKFLVNDNVFKILTLKY